MVPDEARSKRAVRLTLAVGLVLIDVAAVVLGFVTAGLTRFGIALPDTVPVLLGAFLPVYLVSAGLTRAYSDAVILGQRASLLRAMGAIGIAAGVLSLVALFLKATDIVSRAHFAFGLFFSITLVLMFRMIFASYARRQLDGTLYSVIELRDGVPLDPGCAALSVDTATLFDPANPGPATFDRFAKLVGKADRVVVRCGTDRRGVWAHMLQGMNVDAEIVVSGMDDIRPLGTGSHMGAVTLVVARGPLDLRERLTKRLFDVAFALCSLVALCPLMLVTALAIKLDSPGPVFFRQPRIGRQNKLFYVLKFRSMRVDKCDVLGAASTRRADDRVTRVGRFIRRTSIDELPQFINVLLGEMSVVGPRPHAVNSKASNRLFWDIDARYWWRHACRPGLTGLAQVKGYRGSTETLSDLTNRVDADLEYLNQWSFWTDMKIIVRTFQVMVHGNAY